MVINNPIIVTALYDIGRDKWDHYNQSYGGYIHWMERTLSLDSKMVIYTQQRFYDEIKSLRIKYDEDLSKTIFVIQEIEDLDAFKLYNSKLESLMYSEEFKSKISFQVPEMTKPLYNIIMFNKVFWLKHASENKFFDNDMVIWADAGGLREPIEKYNGITWPNINTLNNIPQDKIIFFSHNASFSIHDNQWHALSQVRNIQGTAFAVPSTMIDDFTNEIVKTIDECINQGFIGSDEKIIDFTYLKNPTIGHLIKCTWREYFDILK